MPTPPDPSWPSLQAPRDFYSLAAFCARARARAHQIKTHEIVKLSRSQTPPTLLVTPYYHTMFARQLASQTARRAYSTVAPAAPAAPRRVGAVRGGFLGFLVGVTATGAGSYYYLLDEYKVANNVIVADVAALQSSIASLEKHVKSLEARK